MRNKLRNWFFVLAAGLAASASAGTVAEAASLSPGIGIKVPLAGHDVLLAGYQHNYGDYMVDGKYYWPSDYYAPRRSYYRSYDYDDDYVWSPPRRRTCGQYHYWNGYCCVDARWHKPYIGPKW